VNRPLLLTFGRRKLRRSIWVVGVYHREEVESFAEKNDLAVFSYETYETSEEMLPDEATGNS
jgi:hypothetical protein